MNNNTTHIQLYLIPVIDQDFDRFEVNVELRSKLQEAEEALFYHDTLDPEDFQDLQIPIRNHC